MKAIARYFIRTETTFGDKVKSYATVFDNGAVVIDKYILTKEKKMTGMKMVCKKFNKRLFYGFSVHKFSTLQAIYCLALDELAKNEIKPENIL